MIGPSPISITKMLEDNATEMSREFQRLCLFFGTMRSRNVKIGYDGQGQPVYILTREFIIDQDAIDRVLTERS